MARSPVTQPPPLPRTDLRNRWSPSWCCAALSVDISSYSSRFSSVHTAFTRLTFDATNVCILRSVPISRQTPQPSTESSGVWPICWLNSNFYHFDLAIISVGCVLLWWFAIKFFLCLSGRQKNNFGALADILWISKWPVNTGYDVTDYFRLAVTEVPKNDRKCHIVSLLFISWTVWAWIAKFYRHIHADPSSICTGYDVTNYFRSEATTKKQ